MRRRPSGPARCATGARRAGLRGAVLALCVCALSTAPLRADDGTTEEEPLAPEAEPVILDSEAGVSFYGNDDQLSVVSPWVRGRYVATERVSVDVGWEADVISSASVAASISVYEYL